MSILDNYTQEEIDMMSDEVIQAHKDVDAFGAFVKSLPTKSLPTNSLNLRNSVEMDYMVIGKGKFDIDTDL